jgi:hypothetical protein
MKRYIRSANRFTNRATQLVSKAFSEDYVADKAANGMHKGETMQQVWNNIMNDPDIEISEPDTRNNCTIYYKGKNVGWVNFTNGKGWIDDKEYQQLEKYVAPEEDFYDDI